MHPEMARMMAEQHGHELARRADRQRMVASATGTRARRARLPRYRVHWSRTTLTAAGGPGRRERSWVIVISASRAL
jgi:hypothetical protein